MDAWQRVLCVAMTDTYLAPVKRHTRRLLLASVGGSHSAYRAARAWYTFDWHVGRVRALTIVLVGEDGIGGGNEEGGPQGGPSQEGYVGQGGYVVQSALVKALGKLLDSADARQQAWQVCGFFVWCDKIYTVTQKRDGMCMVMCVACHMLKHVHSHTDDIISMCGQHIHDHHIHVWSTYP